MSKEITVQTKDYPDKSILKDALTEIGIKYEESKGDVLVKRHNNGLDIHLWGDILFSNNKIVMDDMDQNIKIRIDGTTQVNLLSRIKQIYNLKKIQQTIMNFGCGSMTQNVSSDGRIIIKAQMA